MTRIALVSCVSQKLDHAARAKQLYTSPLFRKAYRYASQNADRVYILSAKHGLVKPGTVTEPYDTTLNRMGKAERERWAKDVLQRLRRVADLQHDDFLILAGERYRESLLPYLTHHTIPMEGLGIGKQLAFLSRAENCAELHAFLRSLPRQRFPFEEEDITRDGIYVLFDEGEEAHGGARIVRVGTHTGDHQLRSRLRQHFVDENKDRSIFRKHVERCLLANDPFLAQWNIDLTTRKEREKHAGRIDMEKQRAVEKRVTRYLRKNLSFCTIPVARKYDRLLWEARLIATVASCPSCHASEHWLGNRSPVKAVRESGLWQVNHVDGEPMSAKELSTLKRMCVQRTL